MRLYVMTGDFMTGKTTWIMRMLDLAERERPELAIAGVLCPAIFEDGMKTGIDAVLLPGGERFSCARPRVGDYVEERAHGSGVPAKNERLGWKFDDGAMRRINENFASPACAGCDLLVVDELGPLELCRGEGYTEALTLLDAGTPEAVFAVIRPALLDAARDRWGAFQELTPGSDPSAFLASL